LVPWKDTDRFAERVEQLLRDKDLARRLGGRGREMLTKKQETSPQICPVEQLLLSAAMRRDRKTQYAYET